MAVTDASMTTTTHANFIPEVWSAGALRAVEFAGVVQKRVTRDYEGEIKKGGDTVHVGRISNLQTQTKLSGISNTINFEAITEGVQDLSIATHEYAAFLIENVLEVQSNQDLRAKYEKKIGYALSRGREITLTAAFQNFSQIVGTLGLELATEDYLAAWQKMAESGLLEDMSDGIDASMGDDFSLFLSPAAYAAALKVDVFTNELYNGAANAIQKAQIGRIYGATVFLSNLLRAPAAGQHEGALVHRGALALAVQKVVPVRSDFLIRNLGDGVVGWNLYGSAELNYPPETPGGGTAVDNRAVLLRTV